MLNKRLRKERMNELLQHNSFKSASRNIAN